MSQSSKLNRLLIQGFGIFLGIAIAIWVLRGFGILTFLPGGIILLFLLIAIAMGILSYVQKLGGVFNSYFSIVIYSGISL